MKIFAVESGDGLRVLKIGASFDAGPKARREAMLKVMVGGGREREGKR
jgi:hypothetical protein